MNLFVPPADARLWQAVRPADPGAYLVAIKPAHNLTEAERSCWARLTRRASGDRMFSADWFMASAIRHCGTAANVQLAIVRTLDGEWIGVLPVVFSARFGRCPLPSWQGWLSANQFDAAPLIEAGAEHVFWHCLLAQLDRKPGAALALCLEDMPLDDPATAALVEVCLAGARDLHRTGGFTRPMRVPGPLTAHQHTARIKLDKRLDCLTRKLEREVGAVQIKCLAPEADPAAWMEQFLALEQSGWKGSKASALASETGTARLFRETIRVAHQQGVVRLMSLEAAGRVIAMTSWFVGSTRAYGFKMAYDEAFRSYAPGRLLMRAVADRSAVDHPRLSFDSCASLGAPADPLWPGAREFAHYAVSIGGSPRRSLLASVMLMREFMRARTA